MKYLRFSSFLFSVGSLTGLGVGSLALIFQFFGFVPGLKMLVTNPLVFVEGIYAAFGFMGFDYQFFGWNGPLVAIALLILLALNSFDRTK